MDPRHSARPARRAVRHAALALVLLAVTACGGDGVVPGDVMGPPAGATLSEVQQAVFTPSCALESLGCHAGPAPARGMDLSDGHAFAAVVGVPSVEIPSFVRVDPGNAADSYLYMKITGDPRRSGSAMPLVGGPLDTAKIELVRSWIDAGAHED